MRSQVREQPPEQVADPAGPGILTGHRLLIRVAEPRREVLVADAGEPHDLAGRQVGEECLERVSQCREQPTRGPLVGPAVEHEHAGSLGALAGVGHQVGLAQAGVAHQMDHRRPPAAHRLQGFAEHGLLVRSADQRGSVPWVLASSHDDRSLNSMGGTPGHTRPTVPQSESLRRDARGTLPA